MPEWVAGRIVFVPPQELAVVARRRALWEALDVDFETVCVLAETLEFVYVADRIQCSEVCSGRPDLVDLITTSMASVWKLKKFNESRFLTVGASSRPLLASLLTGVEGGGEIPPCYLDHM